MAPDVSLHELLVWGFGTLGLGGGVLALRAKGSADGAQRAKDSAEAGIYTGALADMTTDRNGWRDACRDLEKRYRESEVERAGIRAQMEAQEHEMEQLRRQVTHLQKMVGRLVDEKTRIVLGSDFASSRMGGLDELGDS